MSDRCIRRGVHAVSRVCSGRAVEARHLGLPNRAATCLRCVHQRIRGGRGPYRRWARIFLRGHGRPFSCRRACAPWAPFGPVALAGVDAAAPTADATSDRRAIGMERPVRATAGQAAARLGADDGWGLGAARGWASDGGGASMSDPATSASATLAAGTSARPLPPLGTRLRLWWPAEQCWFVGRVGEVYESAEAAAGVVHRVDYDDGDVRYYDLASPKPWRSLAAIHRRR